MQQVLLATEKFEQECMEAAEREQREATDAKRCNRWLHRCQSPGGGVERQPGGSREVCHGHRGFLANILNCWMSKYAVTAFVCAFTAFIFFLLGNIRNSNSWSPRSFEDRVWDNLRRKETEAVMFLGNS